MWKGRVVFGFVSLAGSWLEGSNSASSGSGRGLRYSALLSCSRRALAVYRPGESTTAGK